MHACKLSCVVCSEQQQFVCETRNESLTVFACSYCQEQRKLCDKLGAHGPRASLAQPKIMLGAKADLSTPSKVSFAYVSFLFIMVSETAFDFVSLLNTNGFCD